MLTLLAFGRRRGTTEKCLRLLLDTSVEGQLRGFVRKQERAPERKAIVPDRNMGFWPVADIAFRQPRWRLGRSDEPLQPRQT